MQFMCFKVLSAIEGHEAILSNEIDWICSNENATLDATTRMKLNQDQVFVMAWLIVILL